MEQTEFDGMLENKIPSEHEQELERHATEVIAGATNLTALQEVLPSLVEFFGQENMDEMLRNLKAILKVFGEGMTPKQRGVVYAGGALDNYTSAMTRKAGLRTKVKALLKEEYPGE